MNEPAKPQPAKPQPAKPQPAKPQPAKPQLRKPEPATPELPSTPAQIAVVAAALSLPIPAECGPGVAANLQLLARHLDTLRGGASE